MAMWLNNPGEPRECVRFTDSKFNFNTETLTLGDLKIKFKPTTDDKGRECWKPKKRIASWCSKYSRLYHLNIPKELTKEQKLMDQLRAQCLSIYDSMPHDIYIMRENIRKIKDDNVGDDGLFGQCEYFIRRYLNSSKFVEDHPMVCKAMTDFYKEMELKHNLSKRLTRFDKSMNDLPMPCEYFHRGSVPFSDILLYNDVKLVVDYYNRWDFDQILSLFERKMRDIRHTQQMEMFKRLFYAPEGTIYGIRNNYIFGLNEDEISTAVDHITDPSSFIVFANSADTPDRSVVGNYLQVFRRNIEIKYKKYKGLNKRGNGGTYIYRDCDKIFCWQSSDYSIKTHEIESPNDITKKKSVSLGKFCHVCLKRKYSECNGKYIYYNMVRCSGCRSVLYCSRKCQKKDWSRHKKKCLRSVEPTFKHRFTHEDLI